MNNIIKKLILVIAFLFFGSTAHAVVDTLVGNLREPGAIAEDDDHIYFVDRTFFNVTEVIPDQDPSLFTDINFDVFTDPLPFPFTTYNIKKVSKADGTVTALISSLSSIPSIATDGVFVYYVNQGSSGAAGTGAVLKVPVSGGGVIPLATGLNNPVDLAIGDGTVVFIERGYSRQRRSSPFFITCSDFIDNDGDGGTDAPIGPIDEDFDSSCITFGSRSGDSDGDLFTDLTEHTLGSNRLNPDSTPESLVLDSILDLRQSCRDGIDNDLDGLTDGDDPGCIDNDSDGVENIVELDLGSDPEDENSTPEHRNLDESFVEAAFTGRVSKVPMGGGAVTPLVSRLLHPSKVATDGDHVYIIETGSIKKVPMGGGAPEVLFPTHPITFQGSAMSLAVDDSDVYFLVGTSASTTVKKISKHGMHLTDLAETDLSGEIAIDACSVYFFAREGFGGRPELRGVRKSGGPAFTLATDIIRPRDLVVDDRVYFTDAGNGGLPTDGKVWSAVPLFCPGQAIVSLRGLVLTLATQVLNPGQGNSLISKLNVAEKHSNTSKKATSNTLKAFINQTTSFVNKGILPMKQGIELIDQAETIINAIEKPQVQPPPDIGK